MLDKRRGSIYVNVRYIHMVRLCIITSRRICTTSASRHRRVGRPGLHLVGGAFGRHRQACMDRADGAELYPVVAARPRGSRLFDREWADGLLGGGRRGRWQRRMERMQRRMSRMQAAAERWGYGGSGQTIAPRPATAPLTNTAPKPCAGSKKSSASSWNFSTACATPRTRPSLTIHGRAPPPLGRPGTATADHLSPLVGGG